MEPDEAWYICGWSRNTKLYMTSRNWAYRPRKSLANSSFLNLTYVCTVQWIQALINLNINVCNMHTNNSIRSICQIITHRAAWWWLNSSLCADPESNKLSFCIGRGTTLLLLLLLWYFSLIPSEGQKLLLHSKHLSSEEVSLKEHSAFLPITRAILLKSIDSFKPRIHAPLNQQQ